MPLPHDYQVPALE